MYQNDCLFALYECAIIISGLLYAIGITEGITQCVKMFIGRLRPNMYQLCRFNIETLQYSTTITKQQIREGHLSFPSGHSSLASVSMVYCTWYFINYLNRCSNTFDQQQQRSTETNVYQYSNSGLWTLILSLLRTLFIALLLPGWAVYVGMTRIVDHWHHVSDVMAGLLLGSIIGTVVFHSIVQHILHYVNKEVRNFNSSTEEQLICPGINASSMPATDANI